MDFIYYAMGWLIALMKALCGLSTDIKELEL